MEAKKRMLNMINRNEFIKFDVGMESFRKVLEEKSYQLELQNQRSRDKTNFLKKLYNLLIFAGFLLSILTSTYIFLEILDKSQ